ncbi:MAG: MFS transporter [Clostridiales Family XIII bacterium]|jgi:MFS family permease|nr:MFS transporter [Clostridiales Family XIII bacterium]
MTVEPQVNPYSKAPSKKKLLTLIGIYVAALITRFISTSTFTLLPMMALDIGGMEIYPLASSISGILGICAMPVYGYLGSRNPLFKRTLLIGSLSIGTIVLAAISFARSMIMVISVNFFYGVVSASIFVVAFSIIRDMYDAKQAGIYLGFISTMTSIGMLVGPALTGLVIDTLGWRFAYLFCCFFLLIAVILIASGVKIRKEDVDVQNGSVRSFDLPGALAITLFLAGVILCLSFGKSYIPFGSPGNYVLIVLGAISLIALILIVRRKRDKAFIPSTVFSDRNTVVLALCNLFINFSTIALTFFLPSYIINVLNGSALQSGLSTAIYAVFGVFICPFLGRMIAKSGTARGIYTIGGIVRIIITIAYILLLSPQTPILLVYFLMLPAGFYSAVQNVCSTTAPQIQIKEEIRFQSNSVIQTAQNLGSSIGISIYTVVMATYGLVDGMPIALILATITAAIAVIIMQFVRKL